MGRCGLEILDVLWQVITIIRVFRYTKGGLVSMYCDLSFGSGRYRGLKKRVGVGAISDIGRSGCYYMVFNTLWEQ